MATKSLYVGNLPYSITESGLQTEFAPYGGANARIIEGRGFGFVDVDADKMEAAIADKHNSTMGGRTINVNEARPKESNGGGGSRGGGGGYGGGSRGGGGGYGGGRNRY